MSYEQIETLNMRSATIERVCKQIKMQLAHEDYTPVSIIGKSGIGKTESIAGLAAELGIGFKELRLSHYQESDLVGLPYIENGITKHAPASLLPPSDDTNQGILLLDEVTSSQKNMRSAVYQLMDSSRKLGEYKLPPRWIIVAWGNGPQDGGDFRGIEAAFMSRGFCWRVEPNVKVWKDWALKKGLHPTVIAYISFMPDKLHVMDPEARYDMIACPRNWSKLANQLTIMEEIEEETSGKGIVTDDEDLEFISAGCVGANVGPSFAAFYRYNKEVISPEDIINGKVKPEQMANMTDEVLYITAQNLVHLMAEEIRNNTASTPSGVTDGCLKKLCNLMNWCTCLPSVGVRLDVAVTIISDLASSLGTGFSTILMTEEFDKVCPNFLQFCMDNNVVTSLY